MLTNADCTIYTRIPSGDSVQWKRQYIPECWWFENLVSQITTEGLINANKVTVRIPDLTVVIRKDDCIVKGKGPEGVETVKDLKEYDYYKVVSVNYNRFGDEPHIKVVGS